MMRNLKLFSEEVAKIAVATLTLLLLLTIGVSVVSAEAPNQQEAGSNQATPIYNEKVVVRPDLGPTHPGMVPGENGYKVFNPGAIGFVAVQPETSYNLNPMYALYTLYRTGMTDAWEGTLLINGDHSSDSDLYEDDIRVQGAIRRVGSAWEDSCYDQSSGHVASCDTAMTKNGNYFEARSWHDFHTSGYVDSHFQTNDTVSI